MFWTEKGYDMKPIKPLLTISVLQPWSTVTIEYGIPIECAAKLSSFQVMIWGPNIYFMNRDVIYIFGKYNNQQIKWAVQYYIDNMVHWSSSDFML